MAVAEILDRIVERSREGEFLAIGNHSTGIITHMLIRIQPTSIASSLAQMRNGAIYACGTHITIIANGESSALYNICYIVHTQTCTLAANVLQPQFSNCARQSSTKIEGHRKATHRSANRVICNTPAKISPPSFTVIFESVCVCVYICVYILPI